APLLQAAQDTWYKLSALQERFRSTEQLASERLRHLAAAPDDERPGRDPEMLVAEAERVREQEEELREALTEDQMRLAEAVEHRQELERPLARARVGGAAAGEHRQERERQLAAAEGALRAAAKAIADRREGLAKLTGQVNAARARTGSAAEEIERLAAAHTDAVQRGDAAQAAA